MVDAAGIAVDRIDVVFELDMHYLGQTHTVAVPLPVTLSDERHGHHRGGHPRRVRQDLSSRLRPTVAGHPDPHRVAAHSRHRPSARPSICPPSRRRPTPRSTRRSRARARSGSPTPGTRRKCGRGSICRSARRSRRRPCSSSRTPPSSSIRACAAASITSATSSWSAHEHCIDRACCSRSAERLHPHEWRLCARRRQERRHRGAPRAPEAARRCVPQERRAGGGHLVHAGAGAGRRADHLAAPEGAAAVPAQGRLRAGLMGPAARRRARDPPTPASRRSPIRPST